jgi:hypothetical protein
MFRLKPWLAPVDLAETRRSGAVSPASYMVQPCQFGVIPRGKELCDQAAVHFVLAQQRMLLIYTQVSLRFYTE